MPEITKEQDLRGMQIVAGALMMGVLIFAGIAFMIREKDDGSFPVVSMLGAGMAAVMTVLHFVVPAANVRTERDKFDAGEWRATDQEGRYQKLIGVYRHKLIIGLAMLEGAAFFNLIAFIVEGKLWTAGIVAGLMFLMAMQFPTQTRVEHWIEDQSQLIERE